MDSRVALSLREAMAQRASDQREAFAAQLATQRGRVEALRQALQDMKARDSAGRFWMRTLA